MSNKITLKQHILSNSVGLQDSEHPLVALIDHVATACMDISALVTRGELAGILGEAGSENVQGEDQKKLDILSNDMFLEVLQDKGVLAGMASEEMDHMYAIPSGMETGPYLITFDPLDGSSNIDVNGSVGTIFSILETESGSVTDEAFLQPGSRQVCAGYCLYSSATMLVLTTGNGTHGFTLEPASADGADAPEFILTHPDMRIPDKTDSFSINAAYQRHWHPPIRQYVDDMLAGTDGPRGKNFNMRWAGAMVGDVHRILCKGGIFMYPGDAKLQAAGKSGKLRLLYEANPMSFIMEQAGGVASTGDRRIMDLQPEELHQRVPVIMGSKEEVDTVVALHKSAAIG